MKRILTVILGLAMIISSFSVTAIAASDNTEQQVKAETAQDAYARLSAVGVSLDGNSLTAGDYVAALMSFSNPLAKNNDDTFELAKSIGLISFSLTRGDTMQYKDAIKAALVFAGYKQRIEMQDVMSIAASEDLNDNITAAESDAITKDTAAVILSNLLEVKIMQYFGETYKSDGTTVLKKYFNMTKRRIDIVRAEKKENKIYIREGENTVVYYGADGLDFDSVSGGSHWAFFDDEDAICYIKTSGGGFMFWDFVYTVNNSSDQSISYYIDKIEKMTFCNQSEEYEVSEDVIAFYGEDATGNAAYPICGAFVKVLGYDNEITQLNIYNLTEGGLLKTYTGTKLSYTQGTTNDLVSGNINSVSDMTVIIDGLEKTLDDLKKNMVFDYWSNETESSMLIVASSRKAVGDLKSYSPGKVKIADLYYNVSSNVYSFTSYMGRYEKGFLYRPPMYVEAYIDDRCEIRYVKETAEYATLTTIYGFVKNAWTTNGDDDNMVKLIPITGAGSGNDVLEYKLKDKLSSGSLSFEYLKSVASDLDGKGFLKFTVNANGEISKVEPVENMTDPISINFNSSKDTSTYGGYYLDDATMMVLYEIDGEFKVEAMTWKKLWEYYQTGSPQIYLTVDYDPIKNPIPRFGLITGDVQLIENGWNSGGFVRSCEYTEEGTYKVNMGGTTYTFDSDFVEKYGIKEDTFVQLRRRPFEKNGFKYDNDTGSRVIDLSGPVSGWKDILNEEYGAYNDASPTGRLTMGKVILKGDKYIQFEVDGKPTSVFPVTESVRIEEITDGKTRSYADAPVDMGGQQWYQGGQGLRNVRIGDNVMFLAISSNNFVSISRIYYVDDGSIFTSR